MELLHNHMVASFLFLLSSDIRTPSRSGFLLFKFDELLMSLRRLLQSYRESWHKFPKCNGYFTSEVSDQKICKPTLLVYNTFIDVCILINLT